MFEYLKSIVYRVCRQYRIRYLRGYILWLCFVGIFLFFILVKVTYNCYLKSSLNVCLFY